MFLLRDVARKDLPGLKRLAHELNSVNLPNDEKVLSSLIEKSTRSFSAKEPAVRAREYLFVLEDVRNEAIIGTSMIIAQHGTKEAPHIYFDVTEAESYSATLDKHFRHRVLSIGYNYDGPTEIGGLVVDPPYRSGSERAGKQLSYVRFLFMAMHRALFRTRVLAELLPPLLPDGRSLLWESIGKKFTGLDYLQADKLSRENKEFIKELFPASDLYASLFPARVQRMIGEVGPNVVAVRRMLERIGFHYQHRIDPFDGGPHYEADLSDISLVRRHRTAIVAPQHLEVDTDEYLVGISRPGTNQFRAARSFARFDDARVILPAAVKKLLRLKAGDRVSSVPFDETPRVG